MIRSKQVLFLAALVWASVLRAGNVVADWNAIGSTTVIPNEDARDLMNEVFWARMYKGFHFYHSLDAGRILGPTVASGVVRTHFRTRKNR